MMCGAAARGRQPPPVLQIHDGLEAKLDRRIRSLVLELYPPTPLHGAASAPPVRMISWGYKECYYAYG